MFLLSLKKLGFCISGSGPFPSRQWLLTLYPPVKTRPNENPGQAEGEIEIPPFLLPLTSDVSL
jgi:hypothetical protein